ncbi:MAG: winged helix DNA-binding domain-containing protein [Acidimicrobiia bacterium]|nr:winged helix DNA-binding domain-containing protein [Acidimicrobiia bacterium]
MPLRSSTLSADQARRLALGAQGFADAAPTNGVDRRHLRRVMARLNLLQLDSVPVVVRTQYLPAFSRLGPYDQSLHDQVAYRDDEWFEAWAHEASLLPVADEPLLRWAKQAAADGDTWTGLARLAEREPAYVQSVLDEVTERGPMLASELSDPRPRQGNWWAGRSVGRLALDWLFRIGEVGIRRVGNFEKEWDRLDRIVPAEVRAQPTPDRDDAQKELLVRSARALGVGTVGCLVDYYRLPKKQARGQVAELVEDGRLQPVDVEGWSQSGYVVPDVSIPRRVEAAAVVSPFDPVVWNRPRAELLFGFEYRIEIYVPKAKRQYGYYVLPFLLGDRLVARVDVKTDREAGVLRVHAAYAEAHAEPADIAGPLVASLHRLARFVGVDEAAYGTRGDLIAVLARADR